EFKEQKKTMVFVSHSIGQMKQFCEKILWLEYGMVREFGPVDEVMPKYERFLKLWKKMSKKQRDEYRLNALDYQRSFIHQQVSDDQVLPWKDERFLPKESNKFVEDVTSRVGRIEVKKANAYIYQDPRKPENKEPAKKYKHLL